MKLRIAFMALLLAGPALAADNSVVITPGTGVTMRSRDVGSGVESMQEILGDTSGNAIYGTAGTPNSNVLSVQGVVGGTSLTIGQGAAGVAAGAWPTTITDGTNTAAVKAASTAPLATDPAAVFAISPNSPLFPASGTAPSADPGQALTIACQYQASPTSMLTTQTQSVRCLPTGSLMFDYNTINGGIALLTGAGATGTGSPRQTVAQDSSTVAGMTPGTAGAAGTGVVTVQGIASMTPIAVSGALTLSSGTVTANGGGTAGTPNAGVTSIQGITSMTPVQVSQATASNLNATIVGTGGAGTPAGGILTVQGTSGGAALPVAATFSAAATGGATPFHYLSTASTNATNVKATAGTLYSVSAINTTAAIYYLRIYDLAASPTCSSATGVVHNYPIPASTNASGFAIPLGPVGELYANGIGFCLTGALSDTDVTNAATGVAINLSYK